VPTASCAVVLPATSTGGYDPAVSPYRRRCPRRDRVVAVSPFFRTGLGSTVGPSSPTRAAGSLSTSGSGAVLPEGFSFTSRGYLRGSAVVGVLRMVTCHLSIGGVRHAVGSADGKRVVPDLVGLGFDSSQRRGAGGELPVTDSGRSRRPRIDDQVRRPGCDNDHRSGAWRTGPVVEHPGGRAVAAEARGARILPTRSRTRYPSGEG